MAQYSDEDHVRVLLQQHGLNISEDETLQLARAYRANRAVLERLYTMPDVRHEEPALIFDPRK